MLRRFASMLDAQALLLPVRVPDLSRPLPPDLASNHAVCVSRLHPTSTLYPLPSSYLDIGSRSSNSLRKPNSPLQADVRRLVLQLSISHQQRCDRLLDSRKIHSKLICHLHYMWASLP